MTLTEVVRRLRKIGCRVTCQETTAGAWKRWLSYPPGLPAAEARAAVAKALDLGSITAWNCGPYSIGHHGPGYDLMFQTMRYDDFNGVFVAKARRTREGREYAAGIDC